MTHIEMMTTSELATKKILFAALPAEGHVNPLTGLSKHLKETGCDLRFYISDIFGKKMNDLSIDYFPISKAADLNSSNLLERYPQLRTINDPIEKGKFYQKLYVKMAEGHIKDLQEIYQSFPFDLIVVNCTYPSIPLIRHILHVPVLSMGVVPLAEASADLAPYQSGLLPAEDEATREKYRLMRNENAVLFKEGIDQYAALLSAYGVPYDRAEINDLFDFLIKRASLYLQIGSPGFEYKRINQGQNIRFIGPLLPYSKPSSEKKWYDERLKKYTKVILVTQGTIEADTTKLLEPTLQAFVDTDVLVVATTGGNGTQLLREKYPADNLIISDYIPYADVMAHASVYITNGGYGGTLLSIINRLPLVAAGVHEGKNEICARIGYFKIGINLKTETPSSEAIYDAVTEILNNKIYKHNTVKLAQELSTYDPIDLSVQYIKELLDKEG